MADDLLSFAVATQSITSETKLIDALMSRVERFGVRHVAASLTTDHQRNFKFGRGFGRVNMAWAQTYFTEQLYEHDPVMAYALKGEVSTYWGDAVAGANLSAASRQVMERAESADIRDGFLGIVPVIDGVVVVSFQGEELDHDPTVASYLRGLAFYFGAEGHRITSRIPTEVGVTVGFTSQEMRVMHLVMVGLSARAIGDQLGISHRTVEFHRDNARAKLKAANVAEAVALLHSTPQNLFRPS